jgi:tritrans,polycis-undecaprenyl-diphosphate synthase [geranylgeranyl-diphosphate specific]
MVNRIPASIGIIPDGNRRFAKRLMKRPWKGHEWGASKVKTVFGWCRELGIKTITFYALSLENIRNRPKRELGFLFSLARKESEEMLENRDSFVHKNRVRVNFIGKLEKLPKDLQRALKKAEDMTKGYNSYTINFAIAYGGRQEIVDACRAVALDVANGRLRPDEVNESVLKHSLYTNGGADPDLIIRTGGERRLSNFLLFQSAYSELAFIDSLWPEMTKEEFLGAIKDYSMRERRFGR